MKGGKLGGRGGKHFPLGTALDNIGAYLRRCTGFSQVYVKISNSCEIMHTNKELDVKKDNIEKFNA